MGTNVIYEVNIPEKPIAIQIIYDMQIKPFQNMIAIAAGSSIYYYKDLKPSMQFELPLIEFS